MKVGSCCFAVLLTDISRRTEKSSVCLVLLRSRLPYTTLILFIALKVFIAFQGPRRCVADCMCIFGCKTEHTHIHVASLFAKKLRVFATRMSTIVIFPFSLHTYDPLSLHDCRDLGGEPVCRFPSNACYTLCTA